MKYTRILLFLSPLLLLCPPLVPTHTDNLAWSMIGSFYGLVLRRFPWNFVMAGLCYNYAQQLGREAAWWALFSFALPFVSPLVLAFVPPRFQSTAYEVERALGKGREAIGAVGGFDERFPLLERCLAGKSNITRIEQGTRFNPVVSNFEFTALVERGAIERILAEAQTRKFTVWADAGEEGTRLYGAGMVEKPALEETTAWLKRTGLPGEKMDVSWRQPDGGLKFFEYYPV